MNWRAIFDFGYTINEWYRDRHTFFVVLVSFAIYELPQAQTLDRATVMHDLKFAVLMGVVSVMKNWGLNNSNINPPTRRPPEPGA